MTLSDELDQVNAIFIDTAPIIYYIEAHSQFGPLAKEVVTSGPSGFSVGKFEEKCPLSFMGLPLPSREVPLWKRGSRGIFHRDPRSKSPLTPLC